MRPECWDALSALCDGEVVEPDLVREALLDRQAAGFLVAIAETRAALCDESDEPSPAFDARMLQAFARLESKGVLGVVRRLTQRPARMVILGTAAGLVAGLLTGALVAPRMLAPTGWEDVASSSRPVPSVASGDTSAPPPAIPQPADKPDFAFQAGRDWLEPGVNP